ncbi:MAG: hypothetical protein A2Z40_04270 [Deltaproteobacteria bacterium RBG_19FT_COMBO_60_16]|nr:MAG: hypothetical protein A2Z40_04270 [Deltaproteobacteria bacterium RBG_19FT_COMBO_60_16]
MGQRERKKSILDRRFQENLRRLRKASNMKQSELAEKIGWQNSNFVSQLETGIRGFRPETVQRLADFFQVDPAEFFLPGKKRKPLRILFDDSPEEFIETLRGSNLCDTLIEKLREVVVTQYENNKRATE